ITVKPFFGGQVNRGFVDYPSPLLNQLVSCSFWKVYLQFCWQWFSGWVYYRTRKLSLSILIHLVNNRFASIGMLSMDTETMMNKWQLELYGGLINFILITTGAILISIISIFFLRKEFGALRN